MSETDNALKLMSETLTKAVAAIAELINAKATDRQALDQALNKISELQSVASSSDAATTKSLNGLTSILNDLAEKALAATGENSTTSDASVPVTDSATSEVTPVVEPRSDSDAPMNV